MQQSSMEQLRPRCTFLFSYEVCPAKREMRGSDLLFFWWACWEEAFIHNYSLKGGIQSSSHNYQLDIGMLKKECQREAARAWKTKGGSEGWRDAKAVWLYAPVSPPARPAGLMLYKRLSLRVNNELELEPPHAGQQSESAVCLCLLLSCLCVCNGCMFLCRSRIHGPDLQPRALHVLQWRLEIHQLQHIRYVEQNQQCVSEDFQCLHMVIVV